MHLSRNRPCLVARTPDLILELGNRGLVYHRVVLHSQPSVLRPCWWRLFNIPGEILGAIPEAMSGGFPVIGAADDVAPLFGLGEVWVKCTHSEVHEAQRRVIDDITSDNEVFRMFDFSSDKVRDSIIINPELEKNESVPIAIPMARDPPRKPK